MKCACVCSNIRGFCSDVVVEGGRAGGVSSIRRQIDIQSAKDLSAFVFYSAADSLISRGFNNQVDFREARMSLSPMRNKQLRILTLP